MLSTNLKTGMICVLSIAAGAAGAEEYTAKIYSVPAGFDRMAITAAGDDQMMTGYVFDGIARYAAYRTNSGSRMMHPAGWFASQINHSWGSTYHVGEGYPVQFGFSRALYWIGGGPSINLHPTPPDGSTTYNASAAVGGGGQLQVGYVFGFVPCAECGFTTNTHAGTWSRTASSFKRLHSTTHKDCHAAATDGVRQVGSGFERTFGDIQALLWNGPKSFSVSLHPAGFASSEAVAIDGAYQVGSVAGPTTGTLRHAALWAGTAGSMVDLNPAAFDSTRANAVRGNLQVGEGTATTTPERTQAIAWHGSAATWINLHARLPYPFTFWNSSAQGIDSEGNITGYVYRADGTDSRPVIWLRQ